MLSRRSVLRGAGLAATVGTLGVTSELIRPGSVFDTDQQTQLSLTIQTVPADLDERSTEIAQRLANHLRQVGIKASVRLKTPKELRRDVLVDQDFDLYVTRHPGFDDPDGLRSLLHSDFSTQSGWQNPFGYVNADVDELLARQARVSDQKRRMSAVSAIQQTLDRDQPFTPVAIPFRFYVVRSDRYTGWWRVAGESPLRYLGLEHRRATDDNDAESTGGTPETLQLGTTDERVTRSINPISIAAPGERTVISLLYEPLARRYDGPMQGTSPPAIVPWLASGWEWIGQSEDAGLMAEIRLRDDATWHDGTRVTEEDVAFTYRFLTDVSLGGADQPRPAPRYTGRAALVDDVTPLGQRRARITFTRASDRVAERALTVPMLPAHIWRSKARELSETTDPPNGVFDWPNTTNPIGSGPFRVEYIDPGSELLLVRNEDHFLVKNEDATGIDAIDQGPPFRRIAVRVAPAEVTAVDLLIDGELDAIASSIGPHVLPQVGGSPEATLQVKATRSFYHIGYNCRDGPLADPAVRAAIAGLVDKETIVADVFNGYGQPIASPLAGTVWVPGDLRWDQGEPAVEFMGSNGTLDVDRARERFEAAGLQRSETGDLIES